MLFMAHLVDQVLLISKPHYFASTASDSCKIYESSGCSCIAPCRPDYHADCKTATNIEMLHLQDQDQAKKCLNSLKKA